MISSLRKINDLNEYLNKQIKTLQTKLENLEKEYKAKYPEDIYGLKWMMASDAKRTEYLDKLLLFKTYRNGLHDLIYNVEVKELELQQDPYD